MAREYSLRKFIREAPRKLLRQYLEGKGIGANLPWSSLKETAAGAEPIFCAIVAAKEGVREEIDRDFQDIYSMADEAGLGILIEEARDRHHSPELVQVLGGMNGPLEAAFWLLLNAPKAFDIAAHFDHADNLPDRSWLKRHDLPATSPELGDEAEAYLENALCAYYGAHEGRGHFCHVDQWARGKRLYWFAYLDDYAQARMVYQKGQMQRSVQRPAFEVVFVCCEEEGSLEVFARGGTDKVGRLQRLFGQVILGVELDEQPRDRVTYDVSKFLDGSIVLLVQAADGVAEVRVRRLRLAFTGGSRRMTLDASSPEDPRAVYGLLNDVLASKRISRDDLRVTQVGLQLVFRQDGSRRSSNLSFDVSYPNSCSLKHDPRHEVARELLKRWGIDVSGRAKNDSPKRRRSAQTCIRG